MCKSSVLLQGIFLYVDNQKYFGHLVNSENFETTHKHNDLYSLMDNKYVSSRVFAQLNYKNFVTMPKTFIKCHRCQFVISDVGKKILASGLLERLE